MLDFQKLNKDKDKKMNGTLKSWWTLARNKDYAEAHKIKVKADALESFEYDKWEGLRQQEALQKYVSGPRDNLRLTFMLTIFMPCREAQFKHSKQQELLALQKRIQSGREEQLVCYMATNSNASSHLVQPNHSSVDFSSVAPPVAERLARRSASTLNHTQLTIFLYQTI